MGNWIQNTIKAHVIGHIIVVSVWIDFTYPHMISSKLIKSKDYFCLLSFVSNNYSLIFQINGNVAARLFRMVT